MRYVLLIIMLLIVGCGNPVDFHWDTPPEKLEEMARWPSFGYTEWDLVSCDVYIAPFSHFPSDECFIATIQHELRHCREGHFHASTSKDGIEDACK